MDSQNNVNKFIARLKSPFWRNLFYLKSLPLAFFTNLSVDSLTEEDAVVTIPYKWLNKNPFKSMYFGVQAMAGELSTGLLVMLHLQKATKPVSMLVIDFQGKFTKKSAERIFFTCEDGKAIETAIKQTIETGEGIVLTTKSIGRTADGTQVSAFNVVWSLKRKG